MFFAFDFFPFAFLGFLFPILIILFIFRVGSGFFRSITRRWNNKEEVTFDLPGRLKVPSQKDLDGVIFNLAYRLKGRITVSDIIVETGLAMKEAEEVIERMVDGVRVRMEVDPKGMVVYEFPEIISRFEDDPE
jgi:hypothetical protein